MYFLIDFKGRAYWNYPAKNEGFEAPFKPVVFATDDNAKGRFQMQRSYDIWIEPSPNPRVLMVKETTLNDKPARLATILFGNTSEGTHEAKMYFEADKWILLRAEMKVPAVDGNENIVVECTPKRGVSFGPGTFRLDPLKVSGFAKKAKGDVNR